MRKKTFSQIVGNNIKKNEIENHPQMLNIFLVIMSNVEKTQKNDKISGMNILCFFLMFQKDKYLIFF